jgi:hypothetical protein
MRYSTMSGPLLDALARRGVDCVGADATATMQTVAYAAHADDIMYTGTPKESSVVTAPKASSVVTVPKASDGTPPKEPCLATVKDVVAFMAEHDIATTEPNGSVVGVGQWRLGMNASTPAWLLPISEANLTHRAMKYPSRKGLAPFTNVLTVLLDVDVDGNLAFLRLAT